MLKEKKKKKRTLYPAKIQFYKKAKQRQLQTKKVERLRGLQASTTEKFFESNGIDTRLKHRSARKDKEHQKDTLKNQIPGITPKQYWKSSALKTKRIFSRKQ